MLQDYAWLLETKLGLTQERATKVAKGLTNASMRKALTMGKKAKNKQEVGGENELNKETSQPTLPEDEGCLDEEADIDPKEQEEITQLEQKLSDLQAELALPRSEFEQRLMRRLREEVQTNR